MGKIINTLFFLLTVFVHAQSIKGNVEDDNGNTLANVSVFLLRDGAIVENKKTNANGTFILENPKIGDIVKLSSLDYKSTEEEIIKIDDLTFVMYELDNFDDIIHLKDVQLTNKVSVKKDTISYKADQFLIGNENNTEDLLKKIPGVTVDDDGKVKIQGKEIERIMVDGDDLLRKNYKFLSRGLTPKAVEDVELHLNDEENSLLRGTNAENKYAINLKLKKEFKNILFGDVEAGYNLENRYRLNTSLMRLKEKNKTYFTSFMNNIGEDNAQVDYTGNLNSLMYSAISQSSIFPLINISNSFTSIDKEKFNFNNNQFFSFNHIYRFNSKTTLKLNSQLVFDQIKFNQETFQKFFINDSVQTFKDDFKSVTNVFNTTNNLELKSDLSKKSNYQGFAGISVGKENTITNQLFNHISTRQRLENYNLNLQQKNIYTFKGKNDSIVSIISTLIGYQNLPQDFIVHKEDNQFINQNIDLEKSTNALQYQTRYKNKRFLTIFTADYRNENNRLKPKIGSNFMDFNPNELKYAIHDFSFSNYLTYENNRIKIGGNLALSSQHFRYIKPKNYLSFNPNVNFKYKINRSDYLEFSFRSKLDQANFNDLINFNHFTSINSLNKGLDELFFYRSNNAGIRYNYGDYNKLTSFNLGINYNHTNGSLFNQLSFENDVIYNQLLINTKSVETTSLFASADHFIKPIKNSIKLTTYYNHNKGYFLNQNLIEKYKNQQLNIEISLASGFRGFFNYKLTNQFRNNSIQSSYINSDFRFNTKLETYMMLKKFSFNNVFNRTYLSNVDKEIYFFDSDFRYDYNNKLQFSIKARNLLNEKTYSIFQYNILNEINTTYHINPRYILFNVKYKF